VVNVKVDFNKTDFFVIWYIVTRYIWVVNVKVDFKKTDCCCGLK